MSRHRARRDKHASTPGEPSRKPAKTPRTSNQQPAHTLVIPTVALTVALSSATVLAQEQEVLTAPPIEVREQRPGYIVPKLGLSRLPEPSRDIPQTISIVPQELMQQQGVSNLQDALRNVTGISFQAGEGGGRPGKQSLHPGI